MLYIYSTLILGSRGFSDREIDGMLRDALKDPKLKAHFQDIQRELDRRLQTR
jgi:hypothetical protein